MTSNLKQHLHFCNIYKYPANIYRTRRLMKRIDHFKLSETEFHKRYRLSKPTADYLITLLGESVQCNSMRNRALSRREMVLLALRFYACGNFLLTVADYCGVSVATACRVVKNVSFAIAKLSEKFIVMPKTLKDMMETATQFYAISKFPKVIGAIDGTHIKIQSPGGDDAEIFRNRKGYFSLNVQAICNANLEIIDIVARWPGSAHDSNIFNNSRIRARFENKEFGDYVLLGDSGYGCKSFLLTPLSAPQTEGENLYNEAQIRTRNAIERTFGVLKRRFPILSLGMRLKMDTIMNIIVACAVLHNMCRMRNDVLHDLEEEYFYEEIESDSGNHPIENSSCSTRKALIDNYFSKL